MKKKKEVMKLVENFGSLISRFCFCNGTDEKCLKDEIREVCEQIEEEFILHDKCIERLIADLENALEK